MEERQQRSHTIVQEIDLILGTVQELLEFSYGQHGALNLQSCTVQEFIDRVIATLNTRFAGQRITIEKHLEYGGDIQFDRKKMTRVFLNIAENARNAMPEGGTLTITNRLVDNIVHFEFIDQGYGISPELSDRIFEPFVSEGKVNGTGLGLTIVKKILHEHHAHIDIHSVLTKGTTVHISIPRDQASWEEGNELAAGITKTSL
jgi:signal transduction histidine kinase